MDLEKKTLEAMIDIYCKGNHYNKKEDRARDYKPCPICHEQAAYALSKIDACKFKENKPVCSKCPVKCYNSEHKAMIKKIMRYSGPRIIFIHPLLFARYIFRKKIKKA